MKVKRKGYALVFVMGFIGVLFITVALMTQVGQASLAGANTQLRSEQLLYTAEAGIADGLSSIKTQPSYSGSSNTLGTTSYATQVYHEGATAPNGVTVPNGDVYLLSTATQQGLQRQAGVLVRLAADAQPIQAGYMAQNLSLLAASWVDSYNSAMGFYDPLNPGLHGDVSTNSVAPGSIQILALSAVKGTVSVGPGGKLGPTRPLVPTLNGADVCWKDLTCYSLGEQDLTKTVSYPPVGIPDLGAKQGDVNLLLKGSTLTPGNYANLNLGAVSSLNLTGGTYVFDNINALVGQINISGPVQIYVRNSCNLGVSVLVNNTEKPRNCIINLANGAVGNIAGGLAAVGLFYGPGADINVVAGDIYGAVVGRNVVGLGASRVHFDEDLKNFNFDPSNGTSGQTVVSWQRF